MATKTWLDNGGTGTISEMIVGNRALLVVSQTQEVHEEIEDTLEMLRKAGGLKTAAQDVAGEERADGEPPAPARPARCTSGRPARRQGVGGMGMGGMGGMGMGGMGGGMARRPDALCHQRHSRGGPASRAATPTCWEA